MTKDQVPTEEQMQAYRLAASSKVAGFPPLGRGEIADDGWQTLSYVGAEIAIAENLTVKGTIKFEGRLDGLTPVFRNFTWEPEQDLT